MLNVLIQMIKWIEELKQNFIRKQIDNSDNKRVKEIFWKKKSWSTYVKCAKIKAISDLTGNSKKKNTVDIFLLYRSPSSISLMDYNELEMECSHAGICVSK